MKSISEGASGGRVADVLGGLVLRPLEPDGVGDGDAVVVDGRAGLPPPLHQGGAQDEGPAEDWHQKRGD